MVMIDDTAPRARQLPARDYAELKAAFRQLVRLCGGGRAAEHVTRLDETSLSRCGAAHHDQVAPIDVVADLEVEIGAPLVTQVLARLTGHVVVALPQGHGPGQGGWTRMAGDITRQTGEVLIRLGQALENDGRVDRRELHALDLLAQTDEAILLLARLRADLVALRDGA